jgi:hypothetical protein
MDVSMNNSNDLIQNPVEEEIVPVDNGFSLNKIWDDSHLLCYFDDNQKKQWRCLWCNETYRAVFDDYMAKKVSCSSVKVAVAQSIEANNEASAALLTHSQSNIRRKSSSSTPLEVSTITQSTAQSKEYIQLKMPRISC